MLALGTGQRGISAALLIATDVAQDRDAAVMVAVVILVGELIWFPSAAAGPVSCSRRLMGWRWYEPNGQLREARHPDEPG